MDKKHDDGKQQDRTRDCSRLMVHGDTLECGLQRNCRPCCYKMVLYPRKGLLPNQRPEMCPRHQQPTATPTSHAAHQIGLYDGNMLKRILTVGDGNFSFSLALARALPKVEIVATSHETRDSVVTTYPDGEQILRELASCKNAMVLHGIDATNAEQMASLGQFDRILWNFPCVAMPDGEDGQNQEMDQNKQLLHGFFAHAAQRLRSFATTKQANEKETGTGTGTGTDTDSNVVGEIHLTHKTKPPFNQWEIDQIARSHGFEHAFSMVFDRCLYPGYSNKKVLSKDSFPIWDSQTFVFLPTTTNDTGTTNHTFEHKQVGALSSSSTSHPHASKPQPDAEEKADMNDQAPIIIGHFNQTIPLVRLDHQLLEQVYAKLQSSTALARLDNHVKVKVKAKAKTKVRASKAHALNTSSGSSSDRRPKRKESSTTTNKNAHKRQRHK